MAKETILDLLAATLTQEGVPVQRAPELSGLRLGFTGESGQWLCFARVDEEKRIAVFYSIAPFVVPPERREEVMRYLTRASFGLPLGAFELDLDDGEVRFKTSLALGEAEPHKSLLTQLVWTNVAVMDRYLPGLVAASQQGLSADKALSLVEG